MKEGPYILGRFFINLVSVTIVKTIMITSPKNS
jgi:hypothetical protein